MTSTRSSKKGKRGNKKVTYQEDRLSNLPNEILVKILSCLKTREAVSSGILSTRWKSVWASVPVLDLNQYDFDFKGKRCDGDDEREKARFLNFVDQVLIARKMPCLEKIRVHGDTCNPYLLRSWMRVALERNVNKLYVYFGDKSAYSPCELTHSLFSHNKLVILKLSADVTLNFLANSSGFPNLKVLQLDSIIYKDDDSLPNLLSSCPILEDLVIIRGIYDEIGTLNLISRSVKKLKLDSESNHLGGTFVDKIVFDVPAVESLEINSLGTKETEFVVKDLSRLVDAKFEILEVRSFSDTYTLLGGVSHVKFLRLCHRTEEPIEQSDAYYFPTFYNLNRLEIYGGDHCEENYDGPDDELAKILRWKRMLEILLCSPMLENLIYEASADDSENNGKASDWDVANCLVSSLKTIEFNSFSKFDVEKVRYFLLNAQVLEKMTIRHSYDFSKDLKSEICNAIFENEKMSGTLKWSKEEVVISFL